MKKKIFLAILLLCLNEGCTTLNPKNTPPENIDTSLDTSQIIQIALNYDRVTLKKALSVLKKRENSLFQLWKQEKQMNMSNSTQQGDFSRPVFTEIKNLLNEKFKNFPQKKLIHLYILFRDLHPSDDEVTHIFKKMINSESKYVVKIAWIMAQQKPSKSIAYAIENHLTYLLKYKYSFSFYTPELAKAVQANQLKSSYSLIRHGLFETNDIAYAQAMISLRPEKAAADFLNYLSLAPLEELRQLNVESVDLFVCYEILNHLITHEVPITHNHFKHLFYFAISRNHGFADLANAIINRYIPEHAETLALILAKTKSWVQMAYIERTRRNYTVLSGTLLTKLKDISHHTDVVEEIKGVVQ